MKQIFLSSLMIMLLATAGARASLTFTESFTENTPIPEGNPTGVAFSVNVSDIPSNWRVDDLTVQLNLSGGYNGNLYAYLVSPNHTLVVLMNQPGVGVDGFGASGAGMNVTLQDGTVANGNIQNTTSGSVLSGTYNPAETLANFDGSKADGTWTLFFADTTSGGGTSELNSFSLGITAAVPEKTNLAMGVFGGLFLASGVVQACRRKIRKNSPGKTAGSCPAP